MKSKPQPKKHAETVTLQQGEHSEFWDVILRCRDAGDPRWKTFSPGMRASAEAYEKFRNSAQFGTVAAVASVPGVVKVKAA